MEKYVVISMHQFANDLIDLIPILKDQPVWVISIILNLAGFLIILWAIRRYFMNN